MTKWSYTFEPVADRAKVTESFELLRDLPWYFRVADRYVMGIDDRKADLEAGMQETLQRLKAAAERTP